MADIEILGIAGSLRAASFNRLLLRAAAEEAPEGMSVTSFELDAIPPFNADVEAEGDPEPVREMKDAIGEADGLLIATPEYSSHHRNRAETAALDEEQKQDRLRSARLPCARGGASPAD